MRKETCVYGPETWPTMVAASPGMKREALPRSSMHGA
jgi:hypothetical protein